MHKLMYAGTANLFCYLSLFYAFSLKLCFRSTKRSFVFVSLASNEKEGKGDEKAIEKEGRNELKDDREGAQSEKAGTRGEERHGHDTHDDYLVRLEELNFLL